MNFVLARIDKYREEKENLNRDMVYKVYMSEGIRAITINTSRGGGLSLEKDLLEVLGYKTPNIDSRSSEDIINHIGNKLEILGKEDN